MCPFWLHRPVPGTSGPSAPNADRRPPRGGAGAAARRQPAARPRGGIARRGGPGGATALGKRLRSVRLRGRRCGLARPAARGRRGRRRAAAAAARPAATVGRGLVATLSISSSDSSPSVKRTRSGFTSATSMPLIFSPASTRRGLVAGDFAQERGALAVDHERAGQRELAALQPRGAGLRRHRGRTAGRIEERSLDHFGVSGRAADDRVLGQQRRHHRLRRDRLRRRRTALERAAPAGFPADEHEQRGKRKEPPEGGANACGEVGHGTHFLSGSANANPATSS